MDTQLLKLTEQKMLDCYIINLDRAVERWSRVQASAAAHHDFLRVVRVAAVEGRTLSDEKNSSQKNSLHFCSAWQFRMKMGKRVNPREVGCYLSHLKALQMFVDSGAEVALICEDDVTFGEETASVISAALAHRATWDLLRVHGARASSSISYQCLLKDFHLCTTLTGFIYATAYLVHQEAARKLLSLLEPMTLPYDMALFSGRWLIREASIIPSPLTFSEDAANSCIDHAREFRLPLWHPFRLTAIAYRFYARLVRYRVCSERVKERQKYSQN